jgi:hypothetical protein
MGNYTFDIMANSGGLDYSLVLTEYSGGEHGPKLGATFLEPEEIDEVFNKLIDDINAARQKAMDLQIWIPKRDKE